jgi:hypothetical protein
MCLIFAHTPLPCPMVLIIFHRFYELLHRAAGERTVEIDF